MVRLTVAAFAIVLLGAAAGARGPVQPPVPPGPGADPLHIPLDRILDVNVRDGLVYYRALQSGRGALDRYIASLNVPQATYDAWSREAQMAFWVNAYNAVVLQTVVERYPIRGRSADYPSSSIRQIPGAYHARHRLAGRSVTLDEIEKAILPGFREPRLQLALGRGAIGSGRLRSEAYTAGRLDGQLQSVQAEFVANDQMLRIDRVESRISVTPILGWHEQSFIDAYDPGTAGPFGPRSPVERALVAFVTPHLLPLEREFVRQNQFKVTYHAFDWRLNDLTGGGRGE
ncbi:MAG TPA: DUF547 domain-containing protein [Vicinamibacterales bacterium]|nr:DUF547 domain-containing protein [Vicinamibacterales bacterium]